MKAVTLHLHPKDAVKKRSELISNGFAVIFYPALWGGNAHPENRVWCVYGNPNETDYGSLRYLENSLQQSGREYVIIRIRRTPIKTEEKISPS